MVPNINCNIFRAIKSFLNLSQEALSRELGISQQKISKIEAGEAPPTKIIMNNLYRLLKAHGYTQDRGGYKIVSCADPLPSIWLVTSFAKSHLATASDVEYLVVNPSLSESKLHSLLQLNNVDLTSVHIIKDIRCFIGVLSLTQIQPERRRIMAGFLVGRVSCFAFFIRKGSHLMVLEDRSLIEETYKFCTDFYSNIQFK